MKYFKTRCLVAFFALVAMATTTAQQYSQADYKKEAAVRIHAALISVHQIDFDNDPTDTMRNTMLLDLADLSWDLTDKMWTERSTRSAQSKTKDDAAIQVASSLVQIRPMLWAGDPLGTIRDSVLDVLVKDAYDAPRALIIEFNKR